ncbi:hypothetical protein EGW08_013499 [Elysia chlorotica]|uniref:Aminotransferase class I/classII large domain-containing protein n=1 Tax=Elysia chlorotica TaxID=188477 RepID=A0A3S1B341_ELYCH|nr:hypothetical protein EGW08_013499 [Elysia chlorotica]
MDSNSNHSQPEGTPQDPNDAGLSERARKVFGLNPTFMDFMSKTFGNKYHPQTNPEGVVALNVAENHVAINILQPQMEAIARLPEPESIYSYGNPWGEEDFRLSLKNFLERHFHPLYKLDVNQVIVTNGVTELLENLAFALAAPGEYIMIPKPYYFRLDYDFFERAQVLTLPVDQPLPSETPDCRYSLDVTALEKAYLEAARQGKVVRAIHITNPSNPTGDVYTAQELTDLLDFAHKYRLHVIANELYGMSIFDPHVKFTSILSLPHPDPDRVHFLWGFSKDLGLSGLRVSTMYTRNPDLLKFSKAVGYYLRATGMGQNRLRQLIDDVDYIDNQAMPAIRQKMRARNQSVKEEIEACGGRVHPSPATVFRWLDLTSVSYGNLC